jgi:hypothetical protein
VLVIGAGIEAWFSAFKARHGSGREDPVRSRRVSVEQSALHGGAALGRTPRLTNDPSAKAFGSREAVVASHNHSFDSRLVFYEYM